MSDSVIKVENIGKLYKLGEIGTGTISHDLNRWWARMTGKEDPFAKIGEVNDRSTKGSSDWVWALRDINFEVKQGEVLGIIGRNGAGKSTLLKILSKVTTPSTGRIKVKGRIASLLEVGTGFHPELTGRENIFLNGAILGMSKAEIRSKFDEIVDFSGVERYIDTPVKRYSSGMYVRLAFAVAAFLEPEILIIDEVLAVGDSEFQKKCLGRMKDVSVNDGRTVLFVSHNMAAIKSLCNKSLLLKNGCLSDIGEVNVVLEEYLKAQNKNKETEKIEFSKNRRGTGNVVFADFYAETLQGNKIETILTGSDVNLVFVLKVNTPFASKVDIGFSIHDMYGDMQSVLYSSFQEIHFNGLANGYVTVKCELSNISFTPGPVTFRGRIVESGIESDWLYDDLGNFEIEMGNYFGVQTQNAAFVESLNTKYLIKGLWKW
jgi:lipopolysaccharide transport system ATP-binding protein